jgi:Major Facilitator Superfamily
VDNQIYMSARAPAGYGHNRVDSVPFSTTDTAIGSPVSDGAESFRSSASTQDGRGSASFDAGRAERFKSEGGILRVQKGDDDDSVDGLDQLTEQDPLASEQQDPSQLKKKDDMPTWRSMPQKGQLALLVASRFAEPIAGMGLQSYMYYMLKSFDESLTDVQISEQAGWIMAAFTAAQAVSAMFWGRLADSERVGRKKVLITGLTGTAISMFGLGFSKNYYTLMAWRVFGGMLNGNVGVIRTVSHSKPLFTYSTC